MLFDKLKDYFGMWMVGMMIIGGILWCLTLGQILSINLGDDDKKVRFFWEKDKKNG